MDACAQGFPLNGFGPISDRSFFEQLPFSLGIRIGRDEYRRQRMAGRNEPAEKSGSAHLRHLHVGDQAARFIDSVRRQECPR
jgi:hypothetical protein